MMKRFYIFLAVLLISACMPQSPSQINNLDVSQPSEHDTYTTISTWEAAVVTHPETAVNYYNLGLAYATDESSQKHCRFGRKPFG